MTPQALRETGLATLRELIKTKAAAVLARKALLDFDPDGWTMFSAMPGRMEEATVRLIDAALQGEGIAEYLLYECNREPGAVIISDALRYEIASIDDVEKLLREQYPLEGATA